MEQVVAHTVDGARSPNLVDATQVRYSEFEDEDNILILTVKRGERVVGDYASLEGSAPSGG